MPQLEAEQRTDAWRAARAGKVTASLAAACLGLDPYKSRAAAWREITGRGGQADNAYMRWGRRNEPEARRCYEADTGHLALETGFWLHSEHDWLGSSPDGLVGKDGLVEVKCPQTLPEAVPVHHRVQMIVQLACTGRSWCDYYAWTPEGSFLRRILPAGTEGLIRKLRRFYAFFVRTHIEPPSKRTRLTEGCEAWLGTLARMPELGQLNAWLEQLSLMAEGEKKLAWRFIQQYAAGRGWEFDRSTKQFKESACEAGVDG